MHHHFLCSLVILPLCMLLQAVGRPSTVSGNFLSIFLQTFNPWIMLPFSLQHLRAIQLCSRRVSSISPCTCNH